MLSLSLSAMITLCISKIHNYDQNMWGSSNLWEVWKHAHHARRHANSHWNTSTHPCNRQSHERLGQLLMLCHCLWRVCWWRLHRRCRGNICVSPWLCGWEWWTHRPWFRLLLRLCLQTAQSLWLEVVLQLVVIPDLHQQLAITLWAMAKLTFTLNEAVEINNYSSY